jgi:3-oxoacyl-[acyl-carrier protein] reductase
MMSRLESMFGLAGRRAVVTGASRGIGRAIAEALAAAGAEVLVHFHQSESAAREVVSAITDTGGKAWLHCADLRDAASTAALFKSVADRWGALDILVNNAGDMVRRAKLAESDDAQIESVIGVNLTSNLYATRAAIPLLERGKDPVIINLGSVAAHNGGVNGVSIYAATKGAILSLTRSLAKELGPIIRVNGISPGVILTDLHRQPSTDEGLAAIAKNTPLKRNGTPEDCAGAVVFLAGPAAGFITGEVIEINGGLWLA